MYNLLKIGSGNPDAWEQNQGWWYNVSLLRSRMFEHTSDVVKQKFGSTSAPDFDALMKLPCLFTYEGWNVIGSIGKISDIRAEQRQFEIMYTLPDIYPKLVMKEERVFESLGMGAHGSGERHRNHWAVKDVDLFEVATRILYEPGTAQVVLSEGNMNQVWGDGYKGKQLVFLSYRAAYKSKVSEVRVQLEAQGFRCFLAHEDVTPSMLWQKEILKALDTMHIFIGFVTGDFHKGGWPDQEIGYAYQRKVPRVFIKLEGEDPIGMVGGEQALATDWDNAGHEIIAHLKQASIPLPG